MIQAGTPYQTEAIVLRVIDYGDSDRIVTFCTSGFGKIRGIAKGARRSRKRFANALEPFSCLRIQFSRKRPESLALITGCDILSHFSGIRADLEKTLAASYLIDLTDQFTPEDKKHEALFVLLRDFLLLLDGTAVTDALMRFFEVRLLGISGYDPVMTHCLRCKTSIGKQAAYRFDAAKGGLTCDACGPENPAAIGLSLGTIRTLLMARDMEIDRLGRLLLSGQSAEESRRVLSCFIRHILGRELKSVHVLNEIRRLNI